MRLMILRMLTSPSLDGFSAVPAPIVPARPMAYGRPTQHARAGGAATPGTLPVPVGPAGGSSAPPTSRVLPRGSILDLAA
jgi:hypothetical protein